VMENPSAAPVEAPREIKPETGFVEQERVATVSGDIGGVVGGIPGGVPEAGGRARRGPRPQRPCALAATFRPPKRSRT
jgi:hypothetical protein